MVATDTTKFSGELYEAIDLLSKANFGRDNRIINDFCWELGKCVGTSVQPAVNKEYARILTLKEDNCTPAQAIKRIFENPRDWSFDCAEFVQLTILYATLKTYGDQKFNDYVWGLLNKTSSICYERYFTLLPHGSTGIKRVQKYSRYTSPQEEFMDDDGNVIEMSDEVLLKNAPVGTRIAVKNLEAPEGSAFRYENAVKLDEDLYGAHGFSESKLTLSMVKQRLAKITFSSYQGELSLTEYIDRYVFVSEIEIFDTKIK